MSEMKYRLEIELDENRSAFVEEFFKQISFVKSVRKISINEITNPTILKSIEAYETGKVIPTSISLEKLKTLLHA